MYKIVFAFFALLAISWISCSPTGPTGNETAQETTTFQETTRSEGSQVEDNPTEQTSDDQDAGVVDESTAKPPVLSSPRIVEPGLGTTKIRIQPGIAFGKSGKLGSTWTGTDTANALVIYFALLDSEGKATAPIRMDSLQGGSKNEPDICARKEGGYVVAWSVDTKKTDPVNGNLQVRFRVITADGKPEKAEDTQVTTEVKGNHWLANVTCTSDGGFAIAGVRTDTDNKTFGVFLQRYNSKGEPAGKASYVNPKPEGTQAHPVVSASNTGSLVVGWDYSLEKQEQVRFRLYPKPSDTPNDPVTAAGGGTDTAKGINLTMNPVTGEFAIGAILNNGQGVVVKNYKADGTSPTSLTLPKAGPLTLQLGLTSLASSNGYGVIYLTKSGSTSQMHVSIVGNDNPQTLQLASGSLPPYRPVIAYQQGKIAAAWTERTADKGFTVKVAFFP